MARGDGKAGEGKGDGKTVKDVKRGKASEDHQVPINGADEGLPNFTPDGETLDEYLNECVRIYDDNKAIDDRIRNKTSGEREMKKKNTKHVATMEKRLAGDGYGLKALQARKRVRIKQHEAELVSKELDDGQLKEFKRMEQAEKSFATTALGQAAAAADNANVH